MGPSIRDRVANFLSTKEAHFFCFGAQNGWSEIGPIHGLTTIVQSLWVYNDSFSSAGKIWIPGAGHCIFRRLNRAIFTDHSKNLPSFPTFTKLPAEFWAADLLSNHKILNITQEEVKQSLNSSSFDQAKIRFFSEELKT